MSGRFTLGGSYAYVSENDDALNSNLGTGALGGNNGFRPTAFVVFLQLLPTRARHVARVERMPLLLSSLAMATMFLRRVFSMMAPNSTADPRTSPFATPSKSMVSCNSRGRFSSVACFVPEWFPLHNAAAQPLDQDGNGNFGGRNLKPAGTLLLLPSL